ncbi:MAG: AraC family transcriptional regulator [Gammaproteobacteria bacterium]|nr:AraC family transcriptional regulator [Gammaproteobacteria bacterium]
MQDCNASRFLCSNIQQEKAWRESYTPIYRSAHRNRLLIRLYLNPVIPDGTQAVFISPHSTQIGGAQSQALDMQILQPGDYFGIRFYPGALRHFFSLNLTEITDKFVDSEYFPCRYFSQLHNHIYQQGNFLQRVRVCEQWLLRHFTPQLPNSFDQALNLIYQSDGNIEISKLANVIGLSSRHLNRLFRQYIGLSTKTFAQTIRIQSACKQLYKNPKSSLKTAVELGFFDQAHLLKDYKQRLLLSPCSLFDRFRSDFYNSQAL